MREAFSVSATTTGETTVNQEIAEQRGASARDRLLSAAQAAQGIQAQKPHAHIQVFEGAKPVSPVEMAVGHIDGGLRELAGIIQRLTHRLSPVLTPDCDRAQGEGNNPAPVAPAPLVGRIGDLSDQLIESCAALQDLERRLAL